MKWVIFHHVADMVKGYFNVIKVCVYIYIYIYIYNIYIYIYIYIYMVMHISLDICCSVEVKHSDLQMLRIKLEIWWDAYGWTVTINIILQFLPVFGLIRYLVYYLFTYDISYYLCMEPMHWRLVSRCSDMASIQCQLTTMPLFHLSLNNS